MAPSTRMMRNFQVWFLALRIRALSLVLLAVLGIEPAWSQPLVEGPEPRGRNRSSGSRGLGQERLISRRGPSSRAGVPEWEVEDSFRKDIFTFVRIMYGGGGWGRRGGSWRVDYPAADLNFSYRLEELTSMKVNPDGEILEFLDDRLFDYPFIFMIDPRSFRITESEAEALRLYLTNGGFLMVDDFWGERMLATFLGEMEKVFPDRKAQKLSLSHPIFSCVFPLDKFPQVPSEDSAHRNRGTALESWEDEIRGEVPAPANYQAILDDKGRIMVLMCHNTDLSDGWEEEGISQWFFSAYSEKYSYPMGINIVYYALTH